MDFGNIAYATIDNPSGDNSSGETIIAEKQICMHSIFTSASYGSNLFSFGTTVSLNYLKNIEKLGNMSAIGSDYGFGFVLGLLVRPLPELSIAYTIRAASKIEFPIKLDDKNLLSTGDLENTDLHVFNEANYESEYLYQTKFPWNIETGLTYKPFSMMTLSAKMEYQKWSYVYNNNNDILNFHFGMESSILNPVSLSAGFFTQDNPMPALGEYYDLKFLTAGLRWTWNEQLTISGMIMDSQLFAKDKGDYDPPEYITTGKQFNQTIMSAGISYSFR